MRKSKTVADELITRLDLQRATGELWSHIDREAEKVEARVKWGAGSFVVGVASGFLIALFTASFWLKIAVLVLN